MKSKRCSKCREVKLEKFFSRNRTRSDGFNNQCKECMKSYFIENREKVSTQRRAYYEENKEKILREKRGRYAENKELFLKRNRAWREENREQFLEGKRQYQRVYSELIVRNDKALAQEASLEVATRAGDPWTENEDKIVLSSDLPLLEVAIQLGRTYISVTTRRRNLRRKGVLT